MKELTYKDLKPWLTDKNMLWNEHYAAAGKFGTEKPDEAWKRLFGQHMPPKQHTLTKAELWEAGVFVFEGGRTLLFERNHSEIYQIPEEGMRALGLTALPYPEHTPPAPPEGMKWEYRGEGWKGNNETDYYTIDPNRGEPSRGSGVSAGCLGLHYFEAVPILDAESGFTLEKTRTIVDTLFGGTTSENPKESEGMKKCPMQLLPPEFLIQTANVMGFGADRYGAWNFRETPIKLSTYQGAMMRHLVAIANGEDIDESGFPHVAHIAASAAIILDAAKHGKLIDDRPSKS